MLDLKKLLGGLPSVLQYLIVIALVMLLLALALWLTRKIGSHFDSQKVTYDDPEKYAEEVPDLFATTEFRRKKPAKTQDDVDKAADASDKSTGVGDEVADESVEAAGEISRAGDGRDDSAAGQG